MTYRNIGTQPLLLPGGFVLGPGDTFTGELPQSLVEWFVSIGGLAVDPDEDPAVLPDEEEEV